MTPTEIKALFTNSNIDTDLAVDFFDLGLTVENAKHIDVWLCGEQDIGNGKVETTYRATTLINNQMTCFVVDMDEEQKNTLLTIQKHLLSN